MPDQLCEGAVRVADVARFSDKRLQSNLRCVEVMFKCSSASSRISPYHRNKCVASQPRLHPSVNVQGPLPVLNSEDDHTTTRKVSPDMPRCECTKNFLPCLPIILLFLSRFVGVMPSHPHPKKNTIVWGILLLLPHFVHRQCKGTQNAT